MTKKTHAVECFGLQLATCTYSGKVRALISAGGMEAGECLKNPAWEDSSRKNRA